MKQQQSQHKKSQSKIKKLNWFEVFLFNFKFHKQLKKLKKLRKKWHKRELIIK